MSSEQVKETTTPQQECPHCDGAGCVPVARAKKVAKSGSCTFCGGIPANHEYKIWNFQKQSNTIIKICEHCHEMTCKYDD